MLWQKLKWHLKKARIDKYSQLEEGLVEAMKKLKPGDVHGWFRHCGFKLSTI